MTVKVGSLWCDSNMNQFRVVSVAEVEGKTWIYYCNVVTGQEYSCWQESFQHRFRENINQ